MIGKNPMKRHHVKKEIFAVEKFFLNVEDITGADYMHAKRVCKDFKIKKLWEYHGLYV